MNVYFMRTADDNPHALSETAAGLTRCGLRVSAMRQVSDLQVLVYLKGRSCTVCTPSLGGRRRVEPTIHTGQRRAA